MKQNQSKPLVLILITAIVGAIAITFVMMKPNDDAPTNLSRDAASLPESIPSSSAVTPKWPIPAAMMQHLDQLEEDLRLSEAKTPTRHAELATRIENHVTQLISSCTMDGKGHDALHEWLAAFRDLAEKHADAKDSSEQDEIVQEMRLTFTHLHEQFEVGELPAKL